MKQTTSKLSDKPFKLLGFTIEDYIKWCNKNNYKSYLSSSKKEFFKRVNNFRVVRRNNKLFEDGKEL